MSNIALTEQQWAFIRPLLPPPARTGHPRANDRRTLEGILYIYILVTGSRWQDLPREYGAPYEHPEPEWYAQGDLTRG
jgi:transposase